MARPAGWGAYYRNGGLFVKRAPIIAGARYPDFGCNFELFTNPDFLELETLGPLVELRPAESIVHSEHWWLFSNVPNGTGDDWVRSVIVPLIGNQTSSLESSDANIPKPRDVASMRIGQRRGSRLPGGGYDASNPNPPSACIPKLISLTVP